LAAAENPPIDIRSTELTPVHPFGDSYGEASVAVQIECRIDQLVNLLAALQSEGPCYTFPSSTLAALEAALRSYDAPSKAQATYGATAEANGARAADGSIRSRDTRPTALAPPWLNA